MIGRMEKEYKISEIYLKKTGLMLLLEGKWAATLMLPADN